MTTLRLPRLDGTLHAYTPGPPGEWSRPQAPITSRIPLAAAHVVADPRAVTEDMAGPAETFSPAHMLDLRLQPGAEVRLPTPKDYNTALLVLAGEVTANGSRTVAAGEFILFKNDGDEVVVSALTEATVMFLSGAPIEEPLVHYGPFVMNSVDEINEAIDDFNSGKFGHLRD